MDDKAKELLSWFARDANRGRLHLNDWQRLYDFIIYVHLSGQSVGDGEVEESLEIEGVSENVIEEVLTAYSHSIDLLRRYRDMTSHASNG